MIAAVAPSQRCLAFLLPDAVERSFGARLTGGVLFALAGLPVGLPTSSQHGQGKKERHSVMRRWQTGLGQGCNASTHTALVSVRGRGAAFFLS